MKKVLAVWLVSLVVLVFPAVVLASVGVGVGTGKIVVKEPIKTGSIYTLPSVIVFNTGTEAATYTMAVTLNQTQPQLKPDPAWFSFSPNNFSLAPKKSQIVIPTFKAPLKAQAGDYYAYLEARPTQTVKQGKAVVGVAAATKLYFTVKPSNLFISLFYRIVAIYQQYRPWSYILLVIIILILLYLILKRYLHFNVKISRKIDNPPDKS